MRIISGQFKGRIINPPRNLRARPTTDFAKEHLFNVLGGFGFDYAECDVLDLFAGTGSVSYEFASRGARSVTAVEINAVHYAFIRRTAAELGFGAFYAVKANVFNYLRACSRRFDIIFSDAPYDLAGSEQVVDLIFEGGLLRQQGEVRDDGSVSEGGLLIFEHSKGVDFSTHPRFLQSRNYGSVQFTFFS
jgi:16S rRNA (guanine(966)-N(2))-methyltransferase RsmD